MGRDEASLAREMMVSDLRDKLFKAGLVSADQVKKAEVDTRETTRPSGQGPRGDGPRGGERRDGQGPRGGERRDGQGPRGDGPRGDGQRGDGHRGGERRDGGRQRRDEGRAERSEWTPVEPLVLPPEEVERLRKLVQAGRVEGKTRGHRRWYYLARNGSVPYLELSDEAARDLESGATAIAESDRGDATIITRECAESLVATDPGWIRVWARG
jgi:hypothetical protein